MVQEVPTSFANVRTAIQVAQNSLMQLQDFMGGQISNVRLEEVEMAEEQQVWRITLGFDRLAEAPLVPTQVEREYKLFEVSTGTGEVQAMRIRTL
jgi:hypothetical protein